MTRHTQDTFAHDVGIDVGNEGGLFDEFHRIEVDRLKEQVEDDTRIIHALWRREGMWKLIAVLGWGLIGIICLVRLLS